MKAIFLWENFGPMHIDRCDAVAQTGLNVIGLELYGRSDTYDWIPENGQSFKKVTLFNEGRPRGLALIKKLISYRLKYGKANWFMCHYEWKEIFIFACFLRLMGDKVFTMGCSKFDDWERSSIKEAFKRIFFKPYIGAIGSGIRSKDYFRFHGFKKENIATEYNTLSIERIKKMAKILPAPDGTAYEQRHFTIVARLVPKKNLFIALKAYAIYKSNNKIIRPLYICGSGPLEEALKDKVKELNIEDNVFFTGFVQTEQISQYLGTSIVLILPSVEEQFGNVVIEAQALGLPVLLSDVCGARDNLVRTGINGFIFEPDNPHGLALFMTLINDDKELWKNMCKAAKKSALKGDVIQFSKAVNQLLAV